MKHNKYQKYSNQKVLNTPNKSLLRLLILATLSTGVTSITIVTPAFAGDTVSCTDTNCTSRNTALPNTQPDLKDVIYSLAILGGDSLTTDLNSDKRSTISIDGNTVTLNVSMQNINSEATPMDVAGAISESNNVTNNTVNIIDGAIPFFLTGGHSDTGSATGNKVNISGGLVGLRAYGGDSNHGNAANNTINISGGQTEFASGGYSINGNATGNILNISGGLVMHASYGGFSDKGNATGNTVNISGKPTISGMLYGGGSYSSEVDSISDNTLNIKSKDISVPDVRNFENYNFYLDSSVNKGDTMLTLKDNGETDISKSNYGVGVVGGSSLAAGDEVVLISKTSGNLKLSSDTPTNNISGMSGISTEYNFNLNSRNGNQLVATVVGSSINPQTKAILESGLAGIDFVNRGNDLAQKSGIASLGQSLSTGNKVFMAGSAGRYKSETGSHIDVRGANTLIGAGSNFNNTAGTLNVAGFTEFGTGSYDALNDLDGAAELHSDGKTRYYGIGVMAEQQFNNEIAISTGFSAGRSKNDFHSADMIDALGNTTSFDSSRNYISTFVAADYRFAIDNSSDITLSGSIKNTHYNSSNVVISNDTFTLDSINSTRSNIGAEWSKKISNNATFNAGASWEHEFNGTASGNVNNMAIAKPSLKGNTGIINVGYTIQPSEKLTFDVGAQATFGNRRGASVNAVLDYKF